MTSSTRVSSQLKIILRDCLVNLVVGIYPAEMSKPQPVLINVVIVTNINHAFKNPEEMNLERVINYEGVYNFVTQDLIRQKHIGLLETVAEQIVTFCFVDPRVIGVTVRVEKTAVFSQAKGVGVELHRWRGLD